MSFMPVRQISPSGSAKLTAMLRTASGPSGTAGRPPASAKRPNTGIRPALKICAAEIRLPAPLLSNHSPNMKTLFWWTMWSSYALT